MIALIGAAFGDASVTAEVLESVFGPLCHRGMDPQEWEYLTTSILEAVPPQEQGVAMLKRLVADTIDALEAHRARVEARAERDRALAVQSARIDLSKEGRQLLQYMTATDRTLHAALRRLEAMQKPRKPRSGQRTETAPDRDVERSGGSAVGDQPGTPGHGGRTGRRYDRSRADRSRSRARTDPEPEPTVETTRADVFDDRTHFGRRALRPRRPRTRTPF